MAALLLLFLPLETITVETEHYRLFTEAQKKDADEMARVLEAAWKGFERWFKAKPKLKKGEKLVIRHYLTKDAWRKGIEADGVKPPNAGGYYWPGTKTAYLHRQPTRYYSRVLLIHEAAHQFHYLAKTRNKNPIAGWYTEGIAEFLSWHHWDGTKLELGVTPLVSLRDHGAAALKELENEQFDLEKVVEGKEPASRAIAWALVRYLATGKDGEPLSKAAGLLRKMDRGVKPTPTFWRQLGRPPQFRKNFTAWVQQNQQPFAQILNEWQGIGKDRLRGFAKNYTTACRLKQPVDFFQATMQVAGLPKGWRGGVLLHFEDQKNFSVAVIDWAGFVRIARMIDGRWKTLEQGHVPEVERGGDYTFQIFRRKGSVTMLIGNVGFGPWELPGSTFGLAVERSDLRFRDLSWK